MATYMIRGIEYSVAEQDRAQRFWLTPRATLWLTEMKFWIVIIILKVEFVRAALERYPPNTKTHN